MSSADSAAVAVAVPHADVSEEDEVTTIDVKECVVTSVTVHLDSAEVCRQISAKQMDVSRAGKHELVLNNLPNTINKDSIRVEGRGEAVISEVTYMTKSDSDKDDGRNHQLTALKAELEEKELERHNLEDDRKRVSKQRKVLDDVADSLHTNIGKETTNTTAITEFLRMYNKEVDALDKQIQQLNANIKQLDDKIKEIKRSINSIKTTKVDQLSRQCSIILDVKNMGEMYLLFYYLVQNAKWSPSYDIRVHTAAESADASSPSMQLTYYGIVSQETGEDWRDVNLKLATATPSVGGTIPQLGIYTVALATRQPVARFTNQMAFRGSRRKKAAPRMSLQTLRLVDESAMCSRVTSDSFDECMEEEESLSEMEYTAASVNKDTSVNSIFNIYRRSTIVSDNQGHKVCIGIISLSPSFSYECVPRMDATMYLKAKVNNTSDYVLLPGTANIFMNNNFVANSQLKSVRPGEEFTCSLGKFPSIRVTYHPIQTFTKDTGIMSKQICTVYKQIIDIKNTRKTGADVLVREPLPKSNDSKIKIKLLQPADVNSKNSNVALNNKFNHFEWKFNINGGEKKEITLEYSISHPVDHRIDTQITPV